MTKMRIFIACADERLRIAMLLLLENEPGIFVVGITDRLKGLLVQLKHLSRMHCYWNGNCPLNRWKSS